jgi:hypothetical protein
VQGKVVPHVGSGFLTLIWTHGVSVASLAVSGILAQKA